VSIRELSLPLTGFGAQPTEARILVRGLTTRERIRRGVAGPIAGVLMALIVLPIPLVHLIFPPIALVGGLVVGIRRAGQREVFDRAVAPCPFCGTEQRLGLTGDAYRLPQHVKCRECLKPLTLEAA
jgi:hypothetical protein